jgi:PhzF family phenazine biosynthesis protein
LVLLKVKVTKVYSFTRTPGQGNPAGVVLDAEGLTEHQMMKVSRILQVSETAFLFASDQTDYLVRFFSPTREVDLCGHATIAAFTLVGTHYASNTITMKQFIQETRVGMLQVNCFYDENGLTHVMMEQQKSEMTTLDYDNDQITDALNITEESLVCDLPRKRVSTGLFTLPVCIDSLKTLKHMKPNFQAIKGLCERFDVGSFHVFTFDTMEESSVYHARNFAPCYGVNEDPVTGTANGAVCSFLKNCNKIRSDHVVCEQGDIINRAGRVSVDLSLNTVWVGGQAAVDTPRIVQV